MTTLHDGFGGSERLEGWKDIAAYLKRDVRTVQRWEHGEGLPVHRLQHSQRAVPYAFPAELDAWWRERARPLPRAGTPPGIPENGDPGVSGTPPRTVFPQRAVFVGVSLVLAAFVSAVLSTVLRGPRLAFEARDAVLVTAFENRTGESVLDGTVEYAFERELSNSPLLTVLSRDRVEDALRLMRQPADKRLDIGTGREICLRDGAVRALVGGRIDRIGGGYTLSAQIVNPATGVSVASFREDVPGTQDVLRAVRREALAVRKTLGEARASLETSQAQLEKVTTPSLRALQLYSRAAPLVTSPGTSGSAERYLRDALQEDPTFASAHILLAWVIHNSGGARAEYIQHAEEAERLSASATLVERHFIIGSVHDLRAETTDDPSQQHAERAKAVGEYEAVLGVQPDHAWSINNVQAEYGHLRRQADAAGMWGRLADLRPNDFSSNVSAGQALLEAYGLDAARPYIARARALLTLLPPQNVYPDDQNVYPDHQKTYVLLFPAHELWVQRRVQESAGVLATVGGRPEIAADGDSAFTRLGCLHLTLGQLRLAQQAFARIHDGNMRALTSGFLALARNDSQAILDQSASYQGGDLAPVSLLVRAGDLSAAERMLRGLPAGDPLHARWAAAEIEEARGNQLRVHEAVAAGAPWTHDMSGVRAFLYSETLARAAVKAGETAGAIRVLEETGALVEKTYTTSSDSGYFWLRTQLLLADLYRVAGRIDDARAIEKDLRTALAAGDPDHPMRIALQKRPG